MDEKSRGPYVAVTAHLDTVLAPRAKDDISIGPDGKFHGPGVSDNGSGLAPLCSPWRAPSRPSPEIEDRRAEPVLIGNVGEEGEGNLTGMRWLCKSDLAREITTFLVIDGAATDHITTRGLGSRRFEITFTGPGGHSWSDYGIGNPGPRAGPRGGLFYGDETERRTALVVQRGPHRRRHQHQFHPVAGARQSRYPLREQ